MSEIEDISTAPVELVTGIFQKPSEESTIDSDKVDVIEEQVEVEENLEKPSEKLSEVVSAVEQHAVKVKSTENKTKKPSKKKKKVLNNYPTTLDLNCPVCGKIVKHYQVDPEKGEYSCMICNHKRRK